MKIGELASATATKVETVRYYEKIGLLPPPARTSGNYRAYGAGHLARLSFILRAKVECVGASPRLGQGRPDPDGQLRLRHDES